MMDISGVDLGMFADYFSPIILIACLCIGYAIKGIFQNVNVNRFIPLIVMALGLILNVWFEGMVTLPVAVAGMVSGLASTGLYELVDNLLDGISSAAGGSTPNGKHVASE